MSSADETKYGRVPLSVQMKFDRLQYLALSLLAVLVIVLLTSDGLLLYRSSRKVDVANRRGVRVQQSHISTRSSEQGVNWRNVDADGNSCNAFFGNGFTETFEIYKSSDTGGRLISCSGHSTTQAMNCELRNVIMHNDKFEMTFGGETADEMLSRSEQETNGKKRCLPFLNQGAFQVLANGYESVASNIKTSGSVLPASNEEILHGRDLLKKNAPRMKEWLSASDKFKLEFLETTQVLYNKAGEKKFCSLRVEAPVIFVTRVEHANLFHTSTDWYNVWSAAKLAGLELTMTYKVEKLTSRSLVTPFIDSPKFPAHIVFLDGHNAGPVDQGWLSLFLSVSYAKHFSGPTCFDHLIYAPFGYVSAISVGITVRQQECRANPYVRSFSDDFVRGLGLTPRKKSTCSDTGPPKVVFVQRTVSLSHPSKLVRRLDNEDDIMKELRVQASSSESRAILIRGDYASMSIIEQVQSVQDACVIAGAHGAGLSHILFAPPDVHVLEIQPPLFTRPHFVAYSFWSGANHHIWVIDSSSPSAHTVVSKVFEVIKQAVAEAKGETKKSKGKQILF
jgi:glycoprotein 2-beta-D-xylosyltransferase